MQGPVAAEKLSDQNVHRLTKKCDLKIDLFLCNFNDETSNGEVDSSEAFKIWKELMILI